MLEEEGVVDEVLKKLEAAGELDRYADELNAHRMDPYTVSDEILGRVVTQEI